jgi:hypothetical protein
MPDTCPSPAYKALAVTIDGYTLDNPYGSFAIPSDYAGWKLLAENIAGVLQDHYHHLGAIEQKIVDANPGAGFPEWNKYVDEKNAIMERVENLPSRFMASLSGGQLVDAIAKARDATQDSLCLLEQVDASIRNYGEKPKASPGAPTPKDPDTPSLGVLGTIGILTVTAAAFGGVIYVSRRTST